MDHPTSPLRVAHFVQRYPPAVGGSEAYFARLGRFLTARGDAVTVFTSSAVGLTEMWRGSREPRNGSESPDMAPGKSVGASPPFPLREGGPGGLGGWAQATPATRADVVNPSPQPPPPGGEGVPAQLSLPTSPVGLSGLFTVHRFPPLTFPGRRYLLKAASMLPLRGWQALTAPCNPVCPAMWAAAGRYDEPLDAVHATAFPYSFPIACGLRLARRRGVPFFLTPFLHTGDPDDVNDRTRRQYTTPHLRRLLQQADRVFVQSQLEGAAVMGCGVPAERVVLQGLGVDGSECTGGDRAVARQAWGVDVGEVVVGHLANASVEKGTVDLLDAAARVWATGKAFRLVLAGPEMPNFQAAWDRFPHRDRVTRLGVLSDAAKRDFFAGIDAFALPSRSDSFGLVLLEAWANGKPNLVYRAGGPAELVSDGIDGLQARCGDVAGLAEQLRWLVTDPGLRGTLGEAGRVRCERDFRWDDKLGLVRRTMLALRDQKR